MKAYDFTKLTVLQKSLLTFGGWQIGSTVMYQPAPRSVKKLIDRGLLIEVPRKDRSGPWTMTVIEYHVPLDVHRAWCEHCSDMEQP